MDRRRLLMNAFSFPDNYLFKEGKGFKEKLDAYIYDMNGASGSINADGVSINSGGLYNRGYLLLANKIDWIKFSSDESQYVLNSTGLDLSQYSTVNVEMTCYSTEGFPHSIAVINEELIGQLAPATLQRKKIAENLISSELFSKGKNYSDRNGTRQIYSFDISGIDVGTIAIRTGDYSAMYNIIYNIWLE